MTAPLHLLPSGIHTAAQAGGSSEGLEIPPPQAEGLEPG